MRLIFASGFRTGFVPSFRWIPSELTFSDEGSCFFDRDCDPSKSLLHALAHRLTRSSPTWTCDRPSFSPSLMRSDDGEVDQDSHVHVPAEVVQSYASSDDLSDCAGHSPAVSSHKGLPLLGEISTTSLGYSMGHVSSVPLRFLLVLR